MVHGQCLEVGVGGFLLGGGVNALGGTARHGWGAENVLAARAVLADGSRVVGTYYILYWLGSRQIEQDCNIKTSVLQLVTPATVKITRPGGAREKVRLTVRCCDVLLTTYSTAGSPQSLKRSLVRAARRWQQLCGGHRVPL